jgi:hypothetical protein
MKTEAGTEHEAPMSWTVFLESECGQTKCSAQGRMPEMLLSDESNHSVWLCVLGASCELEDIFPGNDPAHVVRHWIPTL